MSIDWNRERVGIVSLGCSRNTVDSEKILAAAASRGARIAPAETASTVLVNTCAFTEEAKRESIETILDLLELKRKGRIRRLFVCGCLAQRYPQDLRLQLKGVDGFRGIADFKRRPDFGVRLTPEHYAYVKIVEGCANRCSFCALPAIKGPLRSRRVASILDEIRCLEARGVKEVNIIGQDITLFGLEKGAARERADGRRLPLVGLLEKILKVTAVPWIRLFYLHPRRMSDALIDLMGSCGRICPYVDLPLQHASDRILKLMNRGYGSADALRLLEKLRRRVPDVALRTTFIVGFPTETRKEFGELLDFVRDVRFDKLGAFIYSREEGTKAFDLKGQVDGPAKRRRYAALMRLQRRISGQRLGGLVGRTVDVLIDEEPEGPAGLYVARTRWDGPEVDGVVFVKSPSKLQRGAIVPCRITDAAEYDLAGEVPS